MKIKATIIPGHGAASGKKNDQRYPKGTIQAQLPYFQERGLDLGDYYPGTLNVDIHPYTYEIRSPKHFFEHVAWTEHIPPENFFFFDIILYHQGLELKGLIYMPDPATKTEHLQKKSTLELLMPKIKELTYGDELYIEPDKDQLHLFQLA